MNPKQAQAMTTAKPMIIRDMSELDESLCASDMSAGDTLWLTAAAVVVDDDSTTDDVIVVIKEVVVETATHDDINASMLHERFDRVVTVT